MKKNTLLFGLIIFMVLFCFDNYAYCDMGLPIIGVTLPAMLLALIPVFLVEAFIYRKLLGVNSGVALKSSFISNLISTIIGIPFSWLLLLAIQILATFGLAKNQFLYNISDRFLQNAWIGGADASEFFTAVTIGLLVSYFASVLIEYLVVKGFFKTIDKKAIKHAVWKANLVTYIALFITLALLTFKNVLNNGLWTYGIFSLIICAVIGNLFLLFRIDKAKHILIYCNLAFVVAIFFTISTLFGLIFDWNEKPAGLVLDRPTGLGRILPDTKWVNLNQQVFYSESNSRDERALCSIDVNGANPIKIIDRFNVFSFIPASDKMFVIADGNLYIASITGKIEKKICSFGFYYEKFGGQQRKRFTAYDGEWSPTGDKFAFRERDEDTNANGIIDWRDNEHVYILDRKTETKQRVNFDKNAINFDKLQWDKSGDVLYVTYWKALSPNDVRYILSSYNINTKEIRQIGEEKSSNGGHINIERYIDKENLFYNTEFYRSWREESLQKNIKPENESIKFAADRQQSSLYIQKNQQPWRKIFESKYKASPKYYPRLGAVKGLYWLPGKRYVILNLKGYLCILDTDTERIGILAKGGSPIWRGRSPEAAIILEDYRP